MTHVARFVIAAPHSGAGKTTVTAVLIAALKARGLTVQPFKVGPDYIDPTHLSAVAECRARNLDGFFLEEPEMLEIFRRAAETADIAVLEGVMGLFDGKDPLGKIGSTAQVAKRLKAPVLLVIDARAMAGSVAAVANGFHRHDPELEIAGVIANKVGSERHADILAEALSAVGIPFLGYLMRQEGLELSSRHLGLYMAGEAHLDTVKLAEAARTLNVPAIERIARGAAPVPRLAHRLPSERVVTHARIGLAQDEAFNFYYPENLELLELFGAELVPFSPLRDAALPPAVGAVYLGGGYPERFAEELSRNNALRSALRSFGGVIYAECGGLMYLSEALKTPEGVFPMVGLVEGVATMLDRPTLGYREVIALRDSPVARAGWTVRGHEFHYSSRPVTPSPAYRRVDGGDREGFASDRVTASYIHLYFPSTPQVAEHLVAQAALYTRNAQMQQAEG